MPKVAVEIRNCKNCPHMKETNFYSTDGWDQMYDWICTKANGKTIAGAVEWHEESKITIPDWCPISIKETQE